MAPLPLNRSAYARAQLPPLLLKNMLYEPTPANTEDQTSLVPRPRLKAFSAPGAGPIRGLYRKGGVLAAAGHSGAIFALSGSTLHRVNQTTGAAVSLGTVDGSGLRMSAEGHLHWLVLTCGTTLYKTDGETLVEAGFPESQAYAVDILNGYFLVASVAGRFYWSDIASSDPTFTSYATAESAPDDLFSLKVIGDELWLFGRLTTEVWQPTGDQDLPFQRINGRVFSIGVTARDTVQKLNIAGVDTVCWLGTDRRVYRTAPNPVRISDASLEERLERASVSATDNAANPYACTISWGGHDLYVLHAPGEGSFAYDLSTGAWAELTSHGRDLFRGAVSAVGPNNMALLGDGYGEAVWVLDNDGRTDGEDPVLFEFSALLEAEGPPMRCANVMLDIATGEAAAPMDDPTVSLSVSDDRGRTWSPPAARPIGRQGVHPAVAWRRLGRVRRPGRIHLWRTTEPVVVTGARFNEEGPR
ncbi:hypothetical protein [Phenylobacterium immobile]|uniref:hypothetical protein n=1 Tax=Phenylobacterium immobile TaxID=21 RepID=UPI000AFAEE60|nr:hypothetical protein [Phenylobacterium immobile]